ncbi:DUF7679 family protein [Companilactobacillus insicii]|uniref:DUF7679 family protein n=1 Tax=Companilactobacillus insicii TaxID=1732567 RepID=UPI000F7A444A|nr:hypothetical protein [Companilactobacillus insicii]
MNKTYYAVKVQRVDGKTFNFRLPRDLQKAMSDYRKESDDWKSILKGALINIEMAPHRTEVQPPITVAMVRGVFIVDKKFMSTRSQFISNDNWKNVDNVHQLYKYMRHDYSFVNRCEIINDIKYWKTGRFNKLIWLFTLSRTKIHYREIKRTRRK